MKKDPLVSVMVPTQDFSKKKEKEVSLIFIIHKGEKNIKPKIEKVRRLFKKTGSSYEIILIYNEGNDKVFQKLKRFTSHLPDVVVIQNRIPLSAGWAIKDAVRYVSGKYVIFYDYRYELLLKDLRRLLQRLEKRTLDLIVGYKKDTERIFHYSWIHRLLRKSYFFIIDLLFGPVNKDILPNVKIFKTPVLESVLAKIVAKVHVLGLELLVVANHLGYKVESLPIELRTDEQCRQRVSLRGIRYALLEILALYYRLRILKYYDREQTLPHDYPPVSIVIPVKARDRYLEECLTACQQLDYPDYEIIVLPDRKFKWQSRREIKIIPTGDIAPPEKRDIGIENARGKIIAFLDSDAYPLSQWLKYGVRYFGDHEIGAVGGPAITPPTDNFWQRASGTIFSSFIVGGNSKFRYAPMPHREVEDYPSCNLLVRRSILKKIEGFNTRLYPGDDTLLCFKITQKAKKKIIYDPDVVVFHHRRPLFFKHFRQLAGYALHRGYFVRKFPQTSCQLSYFLPSLFLITAFFLSLTAIFFPFMRLYWLSFFTLYGALVFLTAFKTMNYKLISIVFLGIIATHITYGLYFIAGLVSQKMPEEKEVKVEGGGLI